MRPGPELRSELQNHKRRRRDISRSHVRRSMSWGLPCARALTSYRFEKSLYDLIRGLRNHKGNEKEYIQNCLKECRSEIRSQDMG